MVLLEIGIAVIVVIVVAVIVMFNGFVSKRNRVQDAWSQIDVQLKRRYDLIPNLVETVRGYMKYEQGVLTKITALRSSIVSGSVQDKAQANNQISQALKSIFAVAENYPQLKASDAYQNLQSQLAETEDKIAFMRTSYNDYVLDFNNAIQTFPGNVFAGMFHFSKFDFFQTPDQERGAVKVNLTDTDTPGVSFGASGQPQQPPQTPKPPKK
ncbi:MAG: LemA family protein [Candidatus Micrarchaeales archaeon]|nr:LemA family protein [Candidatus Micrarchaeales archaeon]